jgi:Zn-dependent protease
MTFSARSFATPCVTCGAELPSSLLACPGCGTLVHARELTRLAGLAEEAERQGELTAALSSWKDALELLPPNAPQRPQIDARIAALHDRIVAGAPASDGVKPGGVRDAWKNKGALAALGLLLLKFKTLIFLLLTKAKLVVLGLTKLKTILSMFAFFGVYWVRYGWKFAAGFVVSLYLHEMGHVVAARRFGIKASAPVFIPFVGAFILLKEAVTDVRVNARIGLAGPVWGLGTALAFYAAYVATGHPLLGAIAGFGAWINVFNLIPVWTLDGARGFTSFTRVDRWCVAVALGAMAAVLHYRPEVHGQGLVVILAAVATGAAIFGRPAEKSDRRMVALYLFLAGSLIAIAATAMSATVGAVAASSGGSGTGF